MNCKSSFKSFFWHTLASTSWGLRRQLIRVHGLKWLPPQMPLLGYENGVLSFSSQVTESLSELERIGLFPNTCAAKNWDALGALAAILKRVPKTGKIMDVGALPQTPFLQWLFLCGYHQLWGIDPTFAGIARRGPITYEPGDITQTRFPDDFFDAISCLSVIEHGVDPRAYLRECSRILKPGGILITSTDYWESPVDTQGKVVCDSPMRIFDRVAIEAFEQYALSVGLACTEPLDLDCDEKVVEWEGVRYTFVMMTMRKEPRTV